MRLNIREVLAVPDSVVYHADSVAFCLALSFDYKTAIQMLRDVDRSKEAGAEGIFQEVFSSR